MKCINKLFSGILVFFLTVCCFSGCTSNTGQSFSYFEMNGTQTLNRTDTVDFFSKELCVSASDVLSDEISFDEDEAAGLFDTDALETVYSYRVHERMDPASMTKVMTALIAIEEGSLDSVLYCNTSDAVFEEGSQRLVMEEGESMTLNQALHFLLVFSANDVAVMIAENLYGDEESFVERMNERANELGATNTHFANPHGLTDERQYTTAYDMYLIFNEAMKHEIFQQIIRLPSYTTEYYKTDGTLKEVSVISTDGFVRENSGISAPAGITVIGGKTGSTYAAGQCLIVLVRNTSGTPFIAVYMHAPDTDTLYSKMSKLLELALY